MKKAFLTLLLCTSFLIGFSQDIMTVLPDSTGRELFSDYLGIKLWGGQFGMNSVNQDLNFKYYSPSNNYTLQHDFNLKNVKSTSNFGLGLEENVGSHLIINFLDVSAGFGHSNIWNWNIGGGAGYFIALDKKRNFRFRATANLFYESISYEFGDYIDTTNLGFYINGNNLGAYIKGVKFVDNSLCASVQASLLFRTKELDIFAGAGWTTVLIDNENINFYSTRIPVNEGIYNSAGKAMSPRLLSQGNYILQIGIMREFGL